ncbi:MAG: hypothetical protein JWM47_3116 [Acidimicrobiales bacterium]|nr:hypothetical protein [Acidimicrobiales bacterium]
MVLVRRRSKVRGVRLVAALPALLTVLAFGAITTPVGAATPASLSVRPTRGPVGTSVTISGVSCASAAGSVALEFQGVPDAGTRGSVSLLDVQPAANGRFSVTFVIPPTMGQVQADLGGPTEPGRYQFTSQVPGCTAAFTVTAGVAGAAAVAARLPATGRPTASLALLGLGLLVLGIAARTAAGRPIGLGGPVCLGLPQRYPTTARARRRSSRKPTAQEGA